MIEIAMCLLIFILGSKSVGKNICHMGTPVPSSSSVTCVILLPLVGLICSSRDWDWAESAGGAEPTQSVLLPELVQFKPILT